MAYSEAVVNSLEFILRAEEVIKPGSAMDRRDFALERLCGPDWREIKRRQGAWPEAPAAI